MKYETKTENVENFENAKLIRLETPAKIDGETHKELIIAESNGLIGGRPMTGVFKTSDEDIVERKITETVREDEALFRIAKDSENHEVTLT